MNIVSLRALLPLSAVLLAGGFTSLLHAQDSEEAGLTEAHKRFVEVLENTDNLFFKEANENGVTFYNILWELNGKSMRMVVSLKSHGTYAGEPVIGMSAWTLVANSEEPVPPAVIKAIATINDRLTLGSVSCSEDFKRVFANFTATAEGLTPGAMWMYCAYLQESAETMKAIIEEANAAAGS